MDEYNKLYSFKSIDFNTFEPLGNNKYQTTAAYNLRILNHILDEMCIRDSPRCLLHSTCNR